MKFRHKIATRNGKSKFERFTSSKSNLQDSERLLLQQYLRFYKIILRFKIH
jgi:hypothetical protein